VSHRITVQPETFTMVKFDAGEFLAIAEDAATAVGVPDDVAIAIEVDEALPLPLIGSAAAVSDDGLALWFTGGAFEDPRYQAQLEPIVSRAELGAAILRGLDRRAGGFADAPPDEEISDRQRAIWDVYAEGRLARLDGFHRARTAPALHVPAALRVQRLRRRRVRAALGPAELQLGRAARDRGPAGRGRHPARGQAGVDPQGLTPRQLTRPGLVSLLFEVLGRDRLVQVEVRCAHEQRRGRGGHVDHDRA
jgi:hypothetical protein